jgi:zinc protease
VTRSVPRTASVITVLLLVTAALLPWPLRAQATATAPLAGPPAPAAPAAQPASGLALDSPLPLDPAVRVGRLDNGLTYYIRRNARPENRALLRLAVKAGSVLEADDQRGLAHFLEHMAFNGTEHFGPGELTATFERAGARFGPHVNAYTSFDETVYMLEVATDREGLLDKGLLALADFGGGMRLDPAEVDKERGVVLEERRQSLGAGSRIRDKQLPVLYHGSRYAERLPIGSPEVLSSFPVERLRDFYTRWYRPDRMAVVVVGTIEPEAVEALVRARFGSLPAASSGENPPAFPVPLHGETLVGVATDKEAQSSSASVSFKRPIEPQGTVGDYRRSLVDGLASQAFNERFGELAQQADAPFLGAVAGGGTLGRTVETFQVSARVNDGGIERGLEAVLAEIRRVQLHGFTAGEVDRARRRLMAGFERAFAEREKAESDGYAREYVAHFLEEEPSPGIDTEFRIASTFVPAITDQEVSARARSLITDTGRVVLAVSPDKAGVTVPTEAALRSTLSAVLARSIDTRTEDAISRPLLQDLPQPGRVTVTRAMPEIGVTVLTLSNGAAVWLKPTTFKNDQVLLSGYSLGGASLAPREDYLEASLSAALVSLAGVGGFDPVELGKVLAGRLVNVQPRISLSDHGISGSSTPKDLETAFQLAYLTFTAPGHDERAFDLLTRRMQASVANRSENPTLLFGERVQAVNASGHYTTEPLTAERIAALRRPVMAEFYRQRFANAADFTFFIVGAFTVEGITPLIERYLASLPGTPPASATVRQVGLRFPSGAVRETVEKGKEARSQTVLAFFADPGADEAERLRLRAAGDVLEIRLRELLREDLGATYGVSVGHSSLFPQKDYGYTGVSYGSSPENALKLGEAVLAEIARLQAEGPSADDLAKVKEMDRRELETAMQQNAFWQGWLRGAHQLGLDPAAVLRRAADIDALTAEQLRDALRRYFPLDRRTVVTLLPEAGAPAGAPER